MNKLLRLINNYPFISWGWAVIVGFFFYFTFAFAKYQFWSRKILNLPLSVNPSSSFESGLYIISLNFATAFTSALIPAVACGLLFIVTVRKSPTKYSFIAAAIYLLLMYRRWLINPSIMFDSDASVIISYTLSPIIATSVLVVLTMIIQSLIRGKRIKTKDSKQ